MLNPPIAGMAMVIDLFMFFVFAAVYLSVIIPYCCSLHKTMRYIPEEKSIFPSWFVWFLLVPSFELIATWMLIPFGIPIGLRNATSDNPAAVRDANTIRNVGLTQQILLTGGFLFFSIADYAAAGHFMMMMMFLVTLLLCVIPGIVLWIIYWVKTKTFRKTYFENRAYSNSLTQAGIVSETSQASVSCSTIVKNNTIIKRPIFLTTWLIYLAVCDVIELLTTIFHHNLMLILFPAWTHPTLIALPIINLLAIMLLWIWKKIGFFLMIATQVVSAIIAGMRFDFFRYLIADHFPMDHVIQAGISVFFNIFSVLIAFTAIAILYFAMKPVWNKFDWCNGDGDGNCV